MPLVLCVDARAHTRTHTCTPCLLLLRWLRAVKTPLLSPTKAARLSLSVQLNRYCCLSILENLYRLYVGTIHYYLAVLFSCFCEFFLFYMKYFPKTGKINSRCHTRFYVEAYV